MLTCSPGPEGGRLSERGAKLGAEFSILGGWACGEDERTLLGVWRQQHRSDDRKQSDFTWRLPALWVLPLQGSQVLLVTLPKAPSGAAPLSGGLVACLSLVSWKHGLKINHPEMFVVRGCRWERTGPSAPCGGVS